MSSSSTPLLPDQPRGRVRRAPARAGRRGRRDPAQPGLLDALRVGDPRRAGDRRAAGARDPPLRRAGARAVAARLGHPRPLLRDDLRARPRRLRRCARPAARAARSGRAVTGAASAEASLERAERVAAELRERELDLLLVASLVNVRYLTGFTGSSALALIAAGRAAPASAVRHRFLTDFRYATQSAEQVPDAFEREIVAGKLIEAAVAPLTWRGREARVRRDEPHRQRARTPARAARRAMGARAVRRDRRGTLPRRAARTRSRGRPRRPSRAPSRRRVPARVG